MDLTPKALDPYRHTAGIGMYVMPRRVWSGWPMLICAALFCAGSALTFAGLILAAMD